MSTLWMGNLEPYMDEKFVTRAFATVGEEVKNVRIIRNKVSGGALGYCFVELLDEATAERCLRKVNGKLLPGANPPRRFKLNRATSTKQGESRTYSLFVGDLTSEVDDGMLYEFFYNLYPSCRGANVVLDSQGNSKGCGFVHFPDERLQKRALEECQGALGLGGKPVRLSMAYNRNKQPQLGNSSWQTNTGGYGYNYNQYSQQYNPYPGYYPQWGYDQSAGSYMYNQVDYTQYTPQAQEQNTAAEEDALEDPNQELDIEEANKKFMELNEELYDALIECHWQPLESSA